jgi:hypothetical protein
MTSTPGDDIPEDYKQQAAEAVGSVQANSAADAAESIEEIQARAVRAAMSEFEQQLADQMKRAQDAFTQQQQMIESLTRQLASVRAQAGPPEAQLLAASVATRLHSIAIANPDLGAPHFAGVVGQGQQLKDAVDAISAAKDDAPTVADAQHLVNSIGTWFARTHPRASNKVLEGSHVLMDELERITDLLPDLAPALSAVKAL